MKITFKKINKGYLEKNKEKISNFVNLVSLNDIGDYDSEKNLKSADSYKKNLTDNRPFLYAAIDENGDIQSICSYYLWDNDHDVYFILDLFMNNLLDVVYPLLYKEILNSYPNIKKIYTEVYKSNPQQVDFYLKNGFEIVYDEAEMAPFLEHPLIEISKNI